MFRFPYRQLLPEQASATARARPGFVSRLVQLVTGRPTAALDLPTSAGATVGMARPFVPIRIRGPLAARRLKYALLDTGSQDTLLPLEIGERLGIVAGGERQAITWRGQRYSVEFHIVELELAQDGAVWRWRARAGFTSAPLAYALLGQRGCLEFLDATFRGADHVAEVDTNRSFPGTTSAER